MPTTAAVTSAWVTVGLVGAVGLGAGAHVVTGTAGVQSWLLLLGLPGVLGLAAGARRSRGRLLVGSAVAVAAVLVGTAVAGFAAHRDSAFVAFALWPLLLVPLPVVAAALAGSSHRWGPAASSS